MVQLIRDLSQKMNCYLTTAELEHRVEMTVNNMETFKLKK